MAGADDPQATGQAVYGRLRVADAELALPLAALREVVPRPVELAALPVPVAGLVGAMQLRSLVVPVLDLRALLGLAGEPAASQVVVVIGAGDSVLGLVADELLGITSLPPEDLLEMRTEVAGTTPALLSRAFRSPEGGGVGFVLDAPALLSLPGVPTVQAVPVTRRGGAQDGPLVESASTSRRGSTLTLLQCGSYVLGLDSEHVHMLVPALTPAPSVLSSSVCMGVTTYDEREVAVLDPLALLGLGATPPDTLGGGLVLDLGTGFVVLAITALLDLVQVPAEDVLPVPSYAVPRPELFAGLADVPGRGQVLVVDGATLVAEPELVALAGLNTLVADQAAGGADRRAAATPLTGRTYLVYSAGTALVTPLEQITEIVPLPDSCTVTGAHPALLGVVVHRRAAVPVLCLTTLLGHPPGQRGPHACALLVHVDGQPVAFVVDALRSIEPLAWEDDQQVHPGNEVRTPRDLLHQSMLVQVGTGGQLLPDLDLRQVARLTGGPLPELPVQRAELEVAPAL